MAIRKTVDEFIYECCDAFIRREKEPELVWALVDDVFLLYTNIGNSFNCATTEFMPVKAKILVNLHLGETLEHHVHLYEDWSDAEMRTEAKQHYGALASRGQFVHELTKNLLVTPTNMLFVVTYEENAMLFKIPRHLRSEMLNMNLTYDLPENVYHLRHNA